MVNNSKHIEAGGIITNYHEAGQGENVLLIHGSGPGVTAWANWGKVFPELSKSFHLYAPDLVAFGYTERKEGVKYNVDVWVDHLISFIETLNIAPLCIVGNSLGGALALHLSYRRPDLVKKVVLMGAAGIRFEITKGLDDVWGYTPSLENMGNLIKTFSYGQEFANNETLIKMRYEASIQDGLQEAFSSMFPAPRQQHVDAIALSEDQLREIKTPMLLIHGREDQVIPVESTSWRLSQILENAELHVFSKCGHWTQIEKAKPFVNLVTNFFQE